MFAIRLADLFSDLALGRPGEKSVNKLALHFRVLYADNPRQGIYRNWKFGAPNFLLRVVGEVEHTKDGAHPDFGLSELIGDLLLTQILLPDEGLDRQGELKRWDVFSLNV